MLSAGLVGALALGCGGGSDNPNAGGASDAARPAWDIGGGVGEHFGPFPYGELNTGAGADQWLTVVLPQDNPIESFYELVDDMRHEGFTVGMAAQGACTQTWSRDEAPFGPEADGFEFGGETPFGEDLPVGATVDGVACEVVAERADGRVGITVRVPLGPGTAEFPNRPVIVLASVTTPAPEAEFRRQDIDLQVTAAASDPLTDNEVELAGLAVRTPLAPRGTLFLPQLESGGCFAVVLRSPSPPAAAVSEAIAQTSFAEYFEGEPRQAAIGDSDVATHRAVIPADGPIISVAAVETESGSDVLVCSLTV